MKDELNIFLERLEEFENLVPNQGDVERYRARQNLETSARVLLRSFAEQIRGVAEKLHHVTDVVQAHDLKMRHRDQVPPARWRVQLYESHGTSEVTGEFATLHEALGRAKGTGYGCLMSHGFRLANRDDRSDPGREGRWTLTTDGVSRLWAEFTINTRPAKVGDVVEMSGKRYRLTKIHEGVTIKINTRPAKVGDVFEMGDLINASFDGLSLGGVSPWAIEEVIE